MLRLYKKTGSHGFRIDAWKNMLLKSINCPVHYGDASGADAVLSYQDSAENHALLG
jgi:hypothetical protein